MRKFEEIAPGVWRMSAMLPGPTVAIVGGVHGDEVVGIEVVRRLKRQLELSSATHSVVQGTLILVLANLKAIEHGTRGSAPGADLNRSFSTKILAGEGGSYECQRARELARVLADVTIGLDIHGTSRTSDPFVFSQPPLGAKAMSIISHLSAGRVVIDPDMVFAGQPVTLDEYFARVRSRATLNRGIGLCYETGKGSDITCLDRVEREVLRALMETGVLSRFPLQATGCAPTVYFLTEPLMCTEGFAFEPDFGGSNFQPVPAGSVVATNGTPIRASEDSVLVFPKPVERQEIGKPAGYLARVVK